MAQSVAVVRTACSYKTATIIICTINAALALHILHNLFSPRYREQSSPHKVSSGGHSDTVKYSPEILKRMREAYEARLAVEPRELMKRVKEIQLEADIEAVRSKDAVDIRQKMALELAQRLKELKEINNQFNQQALDEWRRKKLQKAKYREEAARAKLGADSKVETR